MSKWTEVPTKIRVAQDADGFWTCREAVSGSQQYVREDVVASLLDALHDIAAADGCGPGHVSYLSKKQMADLASRAIAKAAQA